MKWYGVGWGLFCFVFCCCLFCFVFAFALRFTVGFCPKYHQDLLDNRHHLSRHCKELLLSVKSAMSFKHSGIELTGKKAVVLGRNATGGVPMADLLIWKAVTVTLCDLYTVNLMEEVIIQSSFHLFSFSLFWPMWVAHGSMQSVMCVWPLRVKNFNTGHYAQTFQLFHTCHDNRHH